MMKKGSKPDRQELNPERYNLLTEAEKLLALVPLVQQQKFQTRLSTDPVHNPVENSAIYTSLYFSSM